jgi:hypothetical protein
LSDTLKHVFLGSSETLPISIPSYLDDTHECQLVSVLQEHKETIGLAIVDIKGISPSMVMHRIHLEKNANVSHES